MKYYKFEIIVKHDNGRSKIHTVAQSEQDAIDMVVRTERCPERAIVSITQLKQL